MPYSRPGRSYPAVATKVVQAGAPVIEDGIPGVAVKQKEPAFGIGPAFNGITPNAALKTIAIGEEFLIIDKGIVQIADPGTAARGDAIYINEATNVVSGTASGGVKYGMVVEIEGERGTPEGFMRVDLDLKSLF